jgi:hypothetical protein
MCYSATASFGVGAALIPAGVYCVRESLKKDRSYLGFSVVPLMFGIQQLSEGFVWRGLNSGDLQLTKISSLAFLFFAFAIWPFWIPFCSWLVEGRPRVKNRLKIASVIGLAGGILLYVPILLHPGQWLITSIAGHSVRYEFLTVPPLDVVPRSIWQWIYVGFIVGPLLWLQNPHLRIFGALIGVSAIFCDVVYWSEYVSVWCMFAALLSLYLTFAFRQLAVGLRADLR